MSALADLLARLPALAPGVGLAAGAALLGWGGSLWRFTQVAAGVGLGILAGLELGEALRDPDIGRIAAAILAVALAAGFWLVERIAICGLGGMACAAVTQVAWPLVQKGAPSWMVLGIAAGVGIGLAALLHRRVIQVTTAIVGAWLVAAAVGFPGHPAVVGGLALAGGLWQFRVGRGGAPKGKPKKK